MPIPAYLRLTSRQGATVDQLEEELDRTSALLEAAQNDWKKINGLNKVCKIYLSSFMPLTLSLQLLKESLNKRLFRWQEFRRHIALRCKMVFKYNLSQRGYYGNILFNHSSGKLELKVQTDDQNATQGSRDKDPKSLSGGEKSFSTICLLLALWESIGCPLRCLGMFRFHW
jgi:structural maintenance of chromosomes protein 6